MYKLTVDHTKCKNVGECDRIFPEFRAIFGGILFIDQDSKEDMEWRRKAGETQKACPNGAILFKHIP